MFWRLVKKIPKIVKLYSAYNCQYQNTCVSILFFSSKDKMFYTSQDCNQNDQPSAEPSPDAIEAHRRKFPKVVINVGGVRHEVMWRLFLKRPLTRLGMLAKVG